MSRLMDWLPLLEDMAYVAVGFVGLLLLLSNLAPLAQPLAPLGFHLPLMPPGPVASALGFALDADGSGYDLRDAVKVGVTLSLFAVPILVKFFFGVPRGRRPATAGVTKALEAAGPGKKP